MQMIWGCEQKARRPEVITPQNRTKKKKKKYKKIYYKVILLINS